jgi:hypothetical protein
MASQKVACLSGALLFVEIDTGWTATPCRETPLCSLDFSYVCPEPVLAKDQFLA